MNYILNARHSHVSQPKAASIGHHEEVWLHCPTHTNTHTYTKHTYTHFHDKLFKVHHFLDTFSSAFDLHQQCSVDEAMIPFKGRVGFKQYMKDTPTKWEIKVFVLADAINGYVKTFQVYTGRTVEGRSDVGSCTKVVLDLLSEYCNSGLTVYMDNYYSSPQLFAALYDQNINAVGTVRSSSRGFPAAHSFLLRHLFQSRDGPLLSCSWVDKRTIYFFVHSLPR